MLKLSKGDMIDAKTWDGLVVTKVKDSGVNIDSKAFGCSRIPDYFNYNDIDGWSNVDVALNRSDDGMWFGVRLQTDHCFYVAGKDIIEAINNFNNGNLIDD